MELSKFIITVSEFEKQLNSQRIISIRSGVWIKFEFQRVFSLFHLKHILFLEWAYGVPFTTNFPSFCIVCRMRETHTLALATTESRATFFNIVHAERQQKQQQQHEQTENAIWIPSNSYFSILVRTIHNWISICLSLFYFGLVASFFN